MSANVYMKLLGNGAPALPDNWFYRVRTERDSVYGDIIKVSVHERGSLFSRRLGVARVFLKHCPTNDQGLIDYISSDYQHLWCTVEEITADLCRDALKEALKADTRDAILHRARSLEGDHP